MKKQKEIKIIKRGSFDIGTLSEQEQKTFYMTLLARILEIYKTQKERD